MRAAVEVEERGNTGREEGRGRERCGMEGENEVLCGTIEPRMRTHRMRGQGTMGSDDGRIIRRRGEEGAVGGG